MQEKKPKKKDLSQKERFIKKAREIGSDETPAAFDEKLRKIAERLPEDAKHKK